MFNDETIGGVLTSAVPIVISIISVSFTAITYRNVKRIKSLDLRVEARVKINQFDRLFSDTKLLIEQAKISRVNGRYTKVENENWQENIGLKEKLFNASNRYKTSASMLNNTTSIDDLKNLIGDVGKAIIDLKSIFDFCHSSILFDQNTSEAKANRSNHLAAMLVATD
jgi:hypothetical protein